MKKCKSCQSQIDNKATKCPHCQADQRNWFMRHPIITVILGFIFFGAIVNGKSDSQSTPEMKPTAPETKNIVFDVPALLGKNVDEIISIVGQPKEGSLPTEEQEKLTDEWSIEIGKDGLTLLVEYSIKTRVVKELFIDGTDKKKLMEVGNLEENASSYTLKFVKQIKDPSKITGVIITRK